MSYRLLLFFTTLLGPMLGHVLLQRDFSRAVRLASKAKRVPIESVCQLVDDYYADPERTIVEDIRDITYEDTRDFFTVLGHGLFSTTYLAHDKSKSIAVKVISSDPEQVDSTEKELFIWFKLMVRSNQIVVPFRSCFYEEGYQYIISDTFGTDLETFVIDYVLTRKIRLTTQIGMMLRMAIIVEDLLKLEINHNDLNPHNFLVSTENHTIDIRVIDFGLSTLGGETTPTLGHLSFTAPERMQGLEYDERALVYSLGTVFWRLLGDYPQNDDERCFQPEEFYPECVAKTLKHFETFVEEVLELPAYHTLPEFEQIQNFIQLIQFMLREKDSRPGIKAVRAKLSEFYEQAKRFHPGDNISFTYKIL